MIVRKDKSFNKMELYPNTDWLGNADWVLNDNDEKDKALEEKIIGLYPNFEFVFGDDGQPIDVTETEPEPMLPEVTTEQRVSALEDAMEAVINILMEE